MHQCCECHEDFISCDPTAIAMKAKLTPSTNYYYTITDKNGIVVTKAFTTDINGNWSIPKTDLPADYLVQGACFRISVTDAAYDNVPVSMMLTLAVSCIEVNVKCTKGEAKTFIGW